MCGESGTACIRPGGSVNVRERHFMYKIIGADGQQYGPATIEQLRAWTAENRVRADTLVQAEGSQEWKPLKSFPELAGEVKPPLAGPPPQISAFSARASNKIAAGVCGILLGSLGIHKFILGYNSTGVIMLTITLGSFVLGFITCGILIPLAWLASVAMHVIGLIEGIIYLTKTDEEFVRVYVDGRREWF